MNGSRLRFAYIAGLLAAFFILVTPAQVIAHDRRAPPRVVSSQIQSILPAVSLVAVPRNSRGVVKPQPAKWHPWCALLTPDDPMYYVLFCYLDPPPKDPQTFADGRDVRTP